MYSSLVILALVCTAFAIALATLMAFSLVERGHEASLRKLARSERGRVVFLFDGERLLDATPAARQLLETASAGAAQAGWSTLAALLRPRFAALGEVEEGLAEQGEMRLTSSDRLTTLSAEWLEGVARIELLGEDGDSQMARLDRHAVDALRGELSILRDMAANVPYLTWRENERGEIIWANQAYLDIAEAANPANPIPPWPPARLFAPEDLGESALATGPQRAQLALGGEYGEHWFEIHRIQTGDDVQFSAFAADETVRAQKALSEFFTTLTKTFAHLPVGLAIFDQQRKLALFNPALTDLTMLPVEFLCGQPTLFAFLDALRDKRMMPEPKDYKSWRHRLSDLEDMAVNGSYCETWHLPTGQTYRVTGRPHPEGAVAFLFEDITSEISLTRRFRAELEMGQAALDSMGEAVAVFNSSGILSMSNRAYAELWGVDPGTSLADMSVIDATGNWQDMCNPTPVWNQLRAFVRESGDRRRWEAPVTLKDGRALRCRFVPLGNGATLAAFEIASEMAHEFRHRALPALAEAKM